MEKAKKMQTYFFDSNTAKILSSKVWLSKPRIKIKNNVAQEFSKVKYVDAMTFEED